MTTRFTPLPRAGAIGSNVRTIKTFEQAVDTATERRIGALEPGLYTRMGAAIRHVTTALAQRPKSPSLAADADRRQKPNDTDHYEGRFAIEDTRMAVRGGSSSGPDRIRHYHRCRGAPVLPRHLRSRRLCHRRPPLRPGRSPAPTLPPAYPLATLSSCSLSSERTLHHPRSTGAGRTGKFETQVGNGFDGLGRNETIELVGQTKAAPFGLAEFV